MINFGANKQSQLKNQTTADPVLSSLCETIATGWPDHIQDLPPDKRPYWSYRDELAVENGVIFKGKQILIPESLRKDILAQLHASHQGIEKTRRLARESVFWPKINDDIEHLIKSCNHCNEFQPRNKKEPMKAHDIPNGPWQKLGTDLFQVQERHFLLVADYFSKFPVVREMTSPITSNSVTTELKFLCSLFGKPNEIVSDNGPQYAGRDFQQFCDQWGITHTTSSPHYPQSNGFAERMVGTVKPMVKKCIQSDQDIDIAMLNLRATPIDSNLPSPSEMLNGRPINTLLPSRPSRQPPTEHQRTLLQDKQEDMKSQYERRSQKVELPPLRTGQSVTIFNTATKSWSSGKVIKQLDYPPRSYLVETAGKHVRRNRSQLRVVPKPILKNTRNCSPPETKTVTFCQPTPPPTETETMSTSRHGRRINLPQRYKD